MRRWLPELNLLLDGLPDHRRPEMCRYTVRHLLWLPLLMFIFRLGSRRQLHEQSGRLVFHQNLLTLSGTDEATVAHTDTVNVFLERLPTKYLEAVKLRLVKELIRSKRLGCCRLDGDFLVTVDMSGLYRFDSRHCEYCTKQENNGKTTYHHKVSEAKLVSASGLAISVATEYVENMQPGASKQDCETKAFYRLEKKLKTAFPQTGLCLLLDSLYATGPVLEILHDNNWSFFISFKEGSIPTLWEEAWRQRQLHPHNNLEYRPDKTTVQYFRWAHNLPYKKHTVHVIYCEEHAIENGRPVIRNFVWLTDLRPNQNNVAKLANKGGRQRWKIENQGFDDQKQHGFELEHPYGRKENAWKNYYQLLQTAHLISQLITRSDLCAKVQKLQMGNGAPPGPVRSFTDYYSSVKAFVRFILSSFTRCRISSFVFDPAAQRIQIRLPDT